MQELNELGAGKQAQKNADSEETTAFKEHISMEDFANNESPVWRNVEYSDEATKTSIMHKTHDAMVADGAVVTISDEVAQNVDQAYPDLRSMKKKERTPILKNAMNKLKNDLRQFLNGFKNQSFEFEVNGKVLDATLFNTGINEVLEKITKEKANMLYSTEDIFRNARYLYSTPDYDGDPNIYRWNYFYTPIQIGNETVGVRIAVRDVATPRESQIYNWGIKKDASLGGVGRGTNNRISNGASSDASNNNISNTTPVVNTVSENSVVAPGTLEHIQELVALGQGKNERLTTVDTENQLGYDSGEGIITDDEKAALLAYKSGGSYQLNAKLRDGIELDEQQQAIVDGLDSALPKLPVYTGTVYRNLVFDDFGGEEARTSFIDAHAIGDVVTYDAFTSTSSQIDGYPVEGDFPIHIEIRSTNGRNLEGFGNNFESEVLFRRKSKYIVENIVFGADGTPTVYLTEVSYGKQETKAETADRGRTQGDASRDHSGESRSSAETETSQVQRLPAQTSGDSNVQNLPGDNSGENFGRRNDVRGVQSEVRDNESVGAAPSGFDPNSHLQYQYGTLPSGENPVRSDDLPVSTNGTNRVSQTAVTVKGAKVTPDDLADLLDKDVTTADGMTYIPITNDATVQKAFDHITEEGWEAAKAKWHADVRNGKAGADLSATGALLLIHHFIVRSCY